MPKKKYLKFGDLVQGITSKGKRIVGFITRIRTEFFNATKKQEVEIAFKNRHDYGWDTAIVPKDKVKRLGEIKMENIKVGDKVSVFNGEDFISVKITKILRSKKGKITSFEGTTRRGVTVSFLPSNLVGHEH